MRYAPYEFKPDDAYGFARHVGILCKERGDELFFKTCPYCKPRATRGNVNTFSINLKTGQLRGFTPTAMVEPKDEAMVEL